MRQLHDGHFAAGQVCKGKGHDVGARMHGDQLLVELFRMAFSPAPMGASAPFSSPA